MSKPDWDAFERAYAEAAVGSENEIETVGRILLIGRSETARADGEKARAEAAESRGIHVARCMCHDVGDIPEWLDGPGRCIEELEDESGHHHRNSHPYRDKRCAALTLALPTAPEIDDEMRSRD